MTKFYSIFLLLFIFCLGTYSQIVNIPDSNFKAILLANPAINTNGDLEIQISEADSFNDVLEISSAGINDLAGLESFTSVTELYCSGNNLTSIDPSLNPALLIL